MTLKAYKNHILFRFLDAVNTRGEFERAKTSFGLELVGGFDNSAKQPRWAEALAVGPDVKNVHEGDWFLLPALRWTERVVFEDQSYWKTREEEVVCVRSADENSTPAPLNNFVLFKRAEAQALTSSAGLIIVGGTVDTTPTGTVISVAPEVMQELLGARIYFNGSSFFDDVTDRVPGVFSFIRESSIVAYEPLETTPEE